uniref:Uncharacterized protein n=1 Tax=Anopheles atroparvus TaxID=41427 RepID=A0A182J3I8_ANOAO
MWFSHNFYFFFRFSHTLRMSSDSGSICRLCLSKEQKLTRVFEDESGIDDALLKKIFDCTSVKVKLKGIFPSAICAICDLKLNDFYKFREKCIENNTILHDLLGYSEPSKEADGGERECPMTDKHEEKEPNEGDDGGDGEQKQQPATSTTSIAEGQQSESTVAIALNQLSELGLRTMLDLATDGKDDGSEMAGTIRVAKNLLAGVGAPEGGRNVVSSSWGAEEQQAQPSAHATTPKRTFVLAAMKMASERGRVQGKNECKECHRTFRNAYTLRRHNNLHTRTNLFPCEYCGKKFNDRSNWKIHQRSHTGDNLYTCLVCLKTFISPSTLKYHLRSHRRQESFYCRVCHDSFGSYDLLEEHARSLHRQEGNTDMEDFVPDGDHMIDAASFVKIELEDGELPTSNADHGISTTNGCQNDVMMALSVGDNVGGNVDDDDGVRLPNERSILRRKVNQADGDHQGLGSNRSQLGGCPVSHAQVAQLVEQRRQQLLQQVLQEQQQQQQQQANRLGDAANHVPETTTDDMVTAIKEEAPSNGDVVVKEEPQDDSFEINPSELLQQAMEEADADDQEDKERSSSSSSSPSTVIMFRCDYCMKIFHYLDELNAHMVLHNGLKGAGGNSALLLDAQDSEQLMQTSEQHSSLQQLMLKQWTSRSSGSGADECAGTAGVPLYPAMHQLQRMYRQGEGGPTSAGPTERRRAAFEPDPVDVVNAPPPEHPCSKCSKMFRTEELRRVHEATHANDALVNKVRSCRVCNKVFKCELNLLAHLRKHHSGASDPDGGGVAGGDSAGSGNDESCSPVSNLANGNVAQLLAAHATESGPVELCTDGAGAVSDGEAGSSSSGGGQQSAARRCEICAISFTNTVMLEKHVLSHFERNEAVAFVPSTDRPFKCTECHKRFKRKDYLLIHIRTHTGERRYKCDLCSSAFVHPSNLITHRKLHSNERPHKCNLCSATFKLFAGLKIHRRRCEQKLPKLLSGGSDQEDPCFRWSK